MFSGTGSNIQPLLSHSVLAAPSGVLSIYLILLRAVETLPVYVTFCYCSVLWDRIKYTASPLTFCSGCTVWCIIYISHFVACSRDPTCLCNILYCSILWDRIKYTASPLTFCSGCTVWCIIYISHFVACSRDPTCLCNILLLQCSLGQDHIYSLSSHILFWQPRLVYRLYLGNSLLVALHLVLAICFH